MSREARSAIGRQASETRWGKKTRVERVAEESPMLLHIHAAAFQHDDVRILGTRDALEALLVCLQQVLQGPAIGMLCNGFFVNDGEGFAVQIQQVSVAKMHELETPYTAEER